MRRSSDHRFAARSASAVRTRVEARLTMAGIRNGSRNPNERFNARISLEAIDDVAPGGRLEGGQVDPDVEGVVPRRPALQLEDQHEEGQRDERQV